jgi:hypothetical protein
MKYTVIPSTYRTWIVEKEDGEEYVVSTIPGTEKEPQLDVSTFRCTCEYFTISSRICKHIRYVLEYIATGKKEFEDE